MNYNDDNVKKMINAVLDKVNMQLDNHHNLAFKEYLEKALSLTVNVLADPANAKKPEQIKLKMVEGRISKFYDNNCLLDMTYVKDDEMKVCQYVAAAAKEMGGEIKIVDFYRYEKGEGIQKKEENFADEIAKMTAGK